MPSFFKNKISQALGAVDSFVGNIGNEVNSVIDTLGSGLGFSNAANLSIAAKDPTSLIYPLELRSQSNRPCIEFTAYERGEGVVNQHHIWFPCPASIAIADNAAYNTIELGAIGGQVLAAVDAGRDAGGGLGNTITAAAKALKQAELGDVAMQALPVGDTIKQVASFKSKTIMNPNTNTTFTGNGIRNFQFTFKMIAKSQKEADEIRKIHNKFRAFTYADSKNNAQNLTLSYPPVWTIKFLDGNKNENRYIPKIYSCYCTALDSTYNATANLFHEDGAPIEVDVVITFQETRALTRTDINDMEAGLNGDRGVDDNGNPSIQKPQPQQSIEA